MLGIEMAPIQYLYQANKKLGNRKNIKENIAIEFGKDCILDLERFQYKDTRCYHLFRSASVKKNVIFLTCNNFSKKKISNGSRFSIDISI